MKPGSFFMQVCLFLFIALSPIQDIFLQETALRGIGGYPSLFPLLAILIVSLARRLMLGNFNVNRTLLICLGYIMAVTVYGFVFFGTEALGENLFWKATTSSAPIIFFVCAMYVVDYEPQSTVRAALFTAFGILVIGILFSNGNPLGLPSVLNNSVLHFSQGYEDRPRGLSTEPSELSITVIGIGLLCAHVSQSRKAKAFFSLITLILLVTAGSKGGILISFICVLILCLVKWHSKWYHVPVIVMTLVPTGILAAWVSQTLFPPEVVAFGGTVATRGSMFLCALNTVGHHPLGVGFSGFLPAVTTYLPDAISVWQSLIPVPMDFREAYGHLSSGYQVGTTVFFLDQVMRFGIPFVLVYFAYVTRLLRRLEARKETILFVGVLASAVAGTTYIPMVGQFVTPILLGIALKEVRAGTNSSSGE